MKTIIWQKNARNKLTAIPKNEAKRITVAVEKMANSPKQMAHHVKKLKGSDFSRLRVGKWRVVFGDNGMIIDIYDINSRGSIYKK